jgi:Acyl-coenzyme A:6-aminopenicillanic acid acyl-transferase
MSIVDFEAPIEIGQKLAIIGIFKRTVSGSFQFCTNRTADSRNGFRIPLLLRYVLECCSTTAEAVETLSRIPVQMAAVGHHRRNDGPIYTAGVNAIHFRRSSGAGTG